MGNHRFRLSDMMPNAWFYKLKDMSRSRNHNTSHSIKKKLSSAAAAAAAAAATSTKTNLSYPRYSYYSNAEPVEDDMFYGSPINLKASDSHFPDPPRKSSKRRSRRRTIYKPSVSAACGCPAAAIDSLWTESEDYFVSGIEPGYNVSLQPLVGPNTYAASESFPLSASCSCRVCSPARDIFVDMTKKSSSYEVEKLDRFRRSSSKVEEMKSRGSLSVKTVREDSKQTPKEAMADPPVRKAAANSAGVKLRTNSPRLASRKIQAYARKSVYSRTSSKPRIKSLSESCAVVKSSFDPERDFRESMLEMIVENNIRASKDLEELLACYLSLNSDEYHDLIVKAFEQIWFVTSDLRM